MIIQLDTILKVKSFNKIAESCFGDVTLKSGKYVVNGKSLMGIMSLDLTHPLELEVTKANELNRFKEFEIQ